MKKILAICGSTRKQSSNHLLINAIADLYKDELKISLFEGTDTLPHFNPDKAFENTPQEVISFRKQVADADGTLICTPEYAHGVPGSLKNAIDWTVGSGEFSRKPVVLITASTDGRFAHNALLEVLRVIEAKHIDELNLLIQFIQAKISGGRITDEKTLSEVRSLMDRLMMSMNE